MDRCTALERGLCASARTEMHCTMMGRCDVRFCAVGAPGGLTWGGDLVGGFHCSNVVLVDGLDGAPCCGVSRATSPRRLLCQDFVLRTGRARFCPGCLLWLIRGQECVARPFLPFGCLFQRQLPRTSG